MARGRYFCPEGKEATQQNCGNRLPTALSSRPDADGARSGRLGRLSGLGCQARVCRIPSRPIFDPATQMVARDDGEVFCLRHAVAVGGLGSTVLSDAAEEEKGLELSEIES